CNVTAATALSALSLHDALPISARSTSAASASVTVQLTAPLTGLMFSNARPWRTNSPPTRQGSWRPVKGYGWTSLGIRCARRDLSGALAAIVGAGGTQGIIVFCPSAIRSEERRVGKEW